MTLNDELSQIEAAVNECEKELQAGTLDADAIVRQIRSVSNPEAMIAKGGEWVALLMGKLNTLKIVRLKELKHQHPDDTRINTLGTKTVKCYLALFYINASISENLVSPELKAGVQAENQKIRDNVEKLFGGLFQ